MDSFLGIDPGRNGGIAVVNAAGRLIFTEPMPIRKVEGSHRTEYDLDAIGHAVRQATRHNFHLRAAYVEMTSPGGSWSTGGRGAKASYAAGESFGLWRTALHLLMVPALFVYPQTWQRAVLGKFPAGQSKATALRTARRLWPFSDFLATPKSRKPHDGMIDAALIGFFGTLQ